METPNTIDHLVYATPDLDDTVEVLAGKLGVRATAGGRHPGLGTRNALLDLGGGAYLEIIGVDVGGRGPPADGPRPFGLDGIGAPRLATWAARVEDIDERVARAWAVACDPGSVRPMSRRLPDGTDLHWRLTAPSADSVEVVPFLIQWAENAPHPSTTSAKGCTLASFAAEHPVPERVTECLTAFGVELKVSVSATPALVAIIEGPDGTVELR